MAVNKQAGTTCYMAVNSFDYKGPAMTVYILGLVMQGTTMIYASGAVAVPVPSAADFVTWPVGQTLNMNPTGQVIAAGAADGVVYILDGPNASIAKTLASKTFSGAYNFTFPNAQVQNIQASFS